MCCCGVEADEGLKLEVLQVVSLQSENRQAVEGSQGLSVYLADVVVAQLQHLYGRRVSHVHSNTNMRYERCGGLHVHL